MTAVQAQRNPDQALVEDLSRRVVDALGSLPAQTRRCALLDFPNHNNVGDNAIWLGERVALRRAGFDVVYVADLASYRPGELRSRLLPGDAVFLHGGGNLGTVWPHHQRFREKIFADLTEYMVIQLPQSVHFHGRSEQLRFVECVSRHPNAHIWVRDKASMEALDTLAGRTRLVPDSAFAIGVQVPRGQPRNEVVLLARSDHESVFLGRDFGAVRRVDWLQGEPGRPWIHHLHRATVRVRTGFNAAMRSSSRLVQMTEPAREVIFDRLAEARVERGLRILSRGRVIITDRLHAHILSVLLGIPHVCLDNAYGKIARFHEAFTTASRTTRIAVNLVEALEQAQGWSAQYAENT